MRSKSKLCFGHKLQQYSHVSSKYNQTTSQRSRRLSLILIQDTRQLNDDDDDDDDDGGDDDCFYIALFSALGQTQCSPTHVILHE